MWSESNVSLGISSISISRRCHPRTHVRRDFAAPLYSHIFFRENIGKVLDLVSMVTAQEGHELDGV